MKGIYSETELKFFDKWNAIKQDILYFLLVVLNKVGIKANHVTFLSGLTIIATLFAAIHYVSPNIFLWGLLAHLLIDGLDGTLARFQKTDSLKGTVIDVIGDHIGIICTSIFIISFNLANSSLVLVYTLFYTWVIFNALALLHLKTRYKYALRPRIVIYLLLPVALLYKLNLLNYFLFAFSITLFFDSIAGLRKILRRIK